MIREDKMFGLSMKAVTWIIVVIVIVSGLVLGWKSTFAPLFMEADREIQQNSPQYVDSQVSFMLQKLGAITELQAEISELDPVEDADTIAAKEAQIAAFTAELRERVQLIDESEVPVSVTDYLASEDAQ